MSLFIFGGNSKYADDLAVPDPSEEQIPGRHIERCALRYRKNADELSMLRRAVTRLEYIMYGYGIWTIATTDPMGKLGNLLSLLGKML